MSKIGFGGGCHWCTEAVFQTLIGVRHVQQGWISSDEPYDSYSEAIIVDFDEEVIDLNSLVAIHLYTHSCTSTHPLRKKYRSSVYTFEDHQIGKIQNIFAELQKEFEEKIITQILPFKSFKENKEQYQNYYLKNSENQFCKTYINPKFRILMNRFSKLVNHQKLENI